MISISICIALLVAAVAARKLLQGSAGVLAATAATALAVLVMVAACTARVAPTDAAVAVTLTQETSSLDRGLHVKMPTTKVVTIDGTRQESHLPNDGRVFIGDSTEAIVTILLEWRINRDNSGTTFALYRGKDDILGAVRKLQVETSLSSATNSVLGQWNPVDDATGDEDATGAVIRRDYAGQAKQIREAMEDIVHEDGDLIVVEKLTITNINFSAKTQERINALVAESAKERLAQRSIATATAEAARNKAAATQLSEEILRKQCLDTVQLAVESGTPGLLPGGFSCTGPSSAVVTTTK